MLDEEQRSIILRLRREGHGVRHIARALGVSRNSVRRILAAGSATVPRMEREETATAHLDQIRELYVSCEGNLVRVHEELEAEGVVLPYSTLTAFCRRHGIGVKPKERVGRYHFAPGEEMQHDTSPHSVKVGGKTLPLQCASLVLCYSRMIFTQLYVRFNRFWCKVFLTAALRYFDGAARRCMTDNTSVVLARGSGANAVVAPEMEAFSERFGFVFVAHKVGDANRSARVERPFHYIEHNLYPGREFSDLVDLNAQAIEWCDRVNRKYKRKLRAIPAELYAAERPHLRPLPIHIPEVYERHKRTVDSEGYVNLHTNRYSMPTKLISRAVEVRASSDHVRVFDGPRTVVTHVRQPDGAHERKTLDEHKRQRRWTHRQQVPTLPEERVLRTAAPQLDALVTALRKRHGGRAVRAVRRLHQMYLDYPTETLCASVERALAHGLLDLHRIDRMVLRSVATGDFFRVPEDVVGTSDTNDGGDEPQGTDDE